GAPAAKDILENLLQSGKMPHALMLTGPQGIGKAALATQLAWRLICGEGNAGPLSSDETASAWHQLQAGSCPDFHVLQVPEKRKSIGVEDVRQLLSTLHRTADTQRVIVVNTADALTPESANTLLKTLEEPRPGITFILVVHSLAGILPTLRSRCRLVRMAPPAGYAPSTEGEPLQALLEETAKSQTFASAHAYQNILKLAEDVQKLNLPKDDALAYARTLSGQN
ncbi:MAG: hypothetical protein COY40_01740, partial [Alphaproteobacteria bacterium CG_4_10_14_0_8_um_filter_53_9]